MDLGAFSMSLAVKDIHASRDFYAKLGFAEMGGDIDQGWLILKNRGHVIGLFKGMFEHNIMTFNPGWDKDAQNTAEFDDVRDIAGALRAEGMTPVARRRTRRRRGRKLYGSRSGWEHDPCRPTSAKGVIKRLSHL